MDSEMFFGLGALAIFGLIYWYLNRPNLKMDDDINEILTSEKYKVKGRFEE